MGHLTKKRKIEIKETNRKLNRFLSSCSDIAYDAEEFVKTVKDTIKKNQHLELENDCIHTALSLFSEDFAKKVLTTSHRIYNEIPFYSTLSEIEEYMKEISVKKLEETKSELEGHIKLINKDIAYYKKLKIEWEVRQ